MGAGQAAVDAGGEIEPRRNDLQHDAERRDGDGLDRLAVKLEQAAADEGAEHAADAEAAVQHRHDGAAERLFRGNAVGVHGDVHAADHHAHDEAGDDEGDEVGGEDRAEEGEAEAEPGQHGEPGAAQPVDEHARRRHGDDGAAGKGEEREAEQGRACFQPFLGQRNMWYPGTDKGAMQQKGEADSPAGGGGGGVSGHGVTSS